jgi:hypothetical protein
MLRYRKLNGIFWDDVSVFKDNSVLKKFKKDQADWSDSDWVRFHKELISYYLINKWTKQQAEKKATDIVYTDYMNLNFYSRPGLNCDNANYFAKFGIEKDFFTKLICSGVDIVDSTGTIIENIGKTAKDTASITTKIQNNWIPLAILGGIGFYLFKHSKNGKKTKKR